MEDKTVSAVAHVMMTNEYTNFIVQTAVDRVADHAMNYRYWVNYGSAAEADMCFFELKKHHRNYMAAKRALTALAKVAVAMDLENIILPDVPPPEAE